MSEKKLEKLIVDGFKTQDKKFDLIDERITAQNQKISEEFKRQDKKIGAVKKSIEIDMVTHADLDQKFEDHTTMMMKELDRRFAGSDQRFNHVIDELTDIDARLDKLDKRADEEVVDLYKRVKFLEKEVALLKKARV